jgi:hypothetical protein
MPRSSRWSLAFVPPNQNSVSTSPLLHACHMSSPPHPPWFNHPNNIRRRLQVWRESKRCRCADFTFMLGDEICR